MCFAARVDMRAYCVFVLLCLLLLSVCELFYVLLYESPCRSCMFAVAAAAAAAAAVVVVVVVVVVVAVECL